MIDLQKRYTLSPRAAVRPERFGGLVYRYDNRRLYFLYSAELVEFLNHLAGDRSLERALDDFLAARQLPENARPVLLKALAQLKKLEILDEL